MGLELIIAALQLGGGLGHGRGGVGREQILPPQHQLAVGGALVLQAAEVPAGGGLPQARHRREHLLLQSRARGRLRIGGVLQGGQIGLHLQQLLLAGHVGLVLIDHGQVFPLGDFFALAPQQLDHAGRTGHGDL